MIDLRKTMADVLKGFTVHELRVDGDAVVAHATDKNGRHFVLRFAPLADAVDQVEESAPAPEPVAPTVMAPLARSSDMVRRIAQSPKLPPEAKTLVSELARADLRPGDEVRLIEAAQSAVAGDMAPLRALARQHAPPREMHA